MPYLPTDRLIRQMTPPTPDAPAPLSSPIALVSQEGNSRQLSALNQTARTAGLYRAMPVADAQGVCPDLILYDQDTRADARVLKRLGLWAIGYSPLVMLCPPYGLALNITGCAHLFGGGAGLAGLIAPEGVTTVLNFLKNHHNGQFSNLGDICGVDMPTREFRFEVSLLRPDSHR